MPGKGFSYPQNFFYRLNGLQNPYNPGERAKNAIGNVKESIGMALLPMLSSLLTHVTLAYDRNAEQVTKVHFGLDVPPPEPGSQAFSARS